MNTSHPSTDDETVSPAEPIDSRGVRLVCKIGKVACLGLILLFTVAGITALIFESNTVSKSQLVSKKRSGNDKPTSERLVEIGRPVSLSMPNLLYRLHATVNVNNSSPDGTLTERTRTSRGLSFGLSEATDAEKFEIVDDRLLVDGELRSGMVIALVVKEVIYLGLILAGLIILYRFFDYSSKMSLFDETALRLIRKGWIVLLCLVVYHPLTWYGANLVVSQGRAHILLVPFSGLILCGLSYLFIEVLAVSITTKQENDLTV